MIQTQVNNLDFGPELCGARLNINQVHIFDPKLPLVIDIESDEKEKLVSIGVTNDGYNIFYYSEINPSLVDCLEAVPLVGHNLKFDLKFLVNCNFKIKSDQLYADTCLSSYVQNTTKETHSLKDLAKEYLGLTWPSYKMMVGSGKKKLTLDKQPIERVAAYNGMDVLATWRLYQYFQKVLTPQQKHYLETIELPTARALLDMELLGVNIDVPYLQKLDLQFKDQLNRLTKDIKSQWFKEEELNINSNRQIAELLQHQGATLPTTPKGNLKVDKQTLEQWKHLPAVPLLLEYSKIEKLKSTYTESLLEKQKDGKIYCQFNQLGRNSHGQSVGISTGRLSSSSPNLQNVPTRTEEGKLIRKAFIPSEGKVFCDADFSQIEPRLVAHFTKDKTFIEAFRNDKDIYQEIVEGTGRDRQDGKTFMLALLYGAQPRKLASVFKCSEEEADQIIKRIMSKLPGVVAWIARTKYEAHKQKGVYTLFKRFIPLPGLVSDNKYERLHWERVAVNTVIQGSAAEVLKLGLIKLREAGYSTALTVHDEFLIEVNPSDHQGCGIAFHEYEIKAILENLVTLDVPLKVDLGNGENWQEAKL